MLDSAKKDAGRDASKWVNSETTAGYLVKAEARLSDERYRANAYLCTSTDVKLQKVVENELLGENKIQTVLLAHVATFGDHTTGENNDNDGSLDSLFRMTKRLDLKRLYSLFSKVNGGLEVVAVAFRDHVNRQGAELVRQTKDGQGLSTLIVRLSVLHDRYEKDVIEGCFQNDVLFLEAMRTAFESAANIQPTVGRMKMSELVADLFDRELRKAGRGNNTKKAKERACGAIAYMECSFQFIFLLPSFQTCCHFHRLRISSISKTPQNKCIF